MAGGFTSVAVGAVAPSVWTPGHVRGLAFGGLNVLPCQHSPDIQLLSPVKALRFSGALGRVLVSCTHPMSLLQVAALMFSGSCSTLLAVCAEMLFHALRSPAQSSRMLYH